MTVSRFDADSFDSRPGDDSSVIASIRKAINLIELPAPSTLCKGFGRLDMAIWRVLLNLAVSLLPTTGVIEIDTFGFGRIHASKHYTKRTKRFNRISTEPAEIIRAD